MAKQKQNSEKGAVGLQNASAFDVALLQWKAPRYLRYERTWVWFAVLFLLCGALAYYGYATDAITMTASFAILPFVLILEHRKKPDWVDVVISEYGIRFGGTLLPYSNIRSFWIIHKLPVVNELHLQTDDKMHREYVIQLMNVDPTTLRQYLVTQILESEGKHLSLLETLIRLLRLN